LIASLAALAVSNGSLRCSPGSRRLRRLRRNDRVGESTLFSARFIGSSCRSAARTSRARIAPGSRLLRRRSGTKSVSPPSSLHCALRALRLALLSRCLPHSLACETCRDCLQSARSLVQTAGAPAWSARRRAIRCLIGTGYAYADPQEPWAYY
jgi:hypothetical protein